ncbi:MAG: hypothetical protein NPIRA03_41850 [Nitrospirales bacterium]|nr:MAG: hypothetical protein NPIRA03_41850 [Nitrospirales bacterium]
MKFKSKKTKNQEDEVYETRKQAFRASKRDNKIPISMQPNEVVKPNTERGNQERLDDRNRRLYIFRLIESLFGEKGRDIHIREDKEVKYPENKGNQLDHFNAGEPPRLKKHYYYKKK